MKIKLYKLIDMKKVIDKLIAQDVPVIVGYDLIKVVRVFAEELKVYNKIRTKLLKKYGKENKDKKTTTIPKEKVEEFNKELFKVLDKDIKVEVKKIKLSLLGDSVKLSTTDLIKIELITER